MLHSFPAASSEACVCLCVCVCVRTCICVHVCVCDAANNSVCVRCWLLPWQLQDAYSFRAYNSLVSIQDTLLPQSNIYGACAVWKLLSLVPHTRCSCSEVIVGSNCVTVSVMRRCAKCNIELTVLCVRGDVCCSGIAFACSRNIIHWYFIIIIII